MTIDRDHPCKNFGAAYVVEEECPGCIEEQHEYMLDNFDYHEMESNLKTEGETCLVSYDLGGEKFAARWYKSGSFDVLGIGFGISVAEAMLKAWQMARPDDTSRAKIKAAEECQASYLTPRNIGEPDE